MRPTWSSLKLALELVEETPIGAVGNDLVGSRPDKAGLAQPQRIEPDRILGIVLPPPCVRNFLERLERILVARSKSCIDNSPGHALRLGDAKVGGFDDRADETVSRDPIVADIVDVY